MHRKTSIIDFLFVPFSPSTGTCVCDMYTRLGWHPLLITGRAHFGLAQHFIPLFCSCWKGRWMFVRRPAPGSLSATTHSLLLHNTPYYDDCCQLWTSPCSCLCRTIRRMSPTFLRRNFFRCAVRVISALDFLGPCLNAHEDGISLIHVENGTCV